MKLDKAKGWVAFIIALTTLVGTAFTLDNRYAKQTQTTAKIDSVEQTIQQVEQRLDKKILKDRADVLQERFQTDNHSMPMCCAAMQTRFQQGRDFFRRGKDRHDWHDCINAEPSSTFEILFALCFYN